MTNRTPGTALAVATIALIVGALVATVAPGGAQTDNPLPGVWYGVTTDGSDTHTVTVLFGAGTMSSMPFALVDFVPVGCADGTPEILVGRASLRGDEVVFGRSTRYCGDRSTRVVSAFPMDWDSEGRIDSVTPDDVPVELRRVCPRSVPDAFAGGIVGDLVGTEAGETLTGTDGDDVINGFGGNDTIVALAGNDIVCGNTGIDTISAGQGVDVVWGADGGDVLRGEAGRDVVFGGSASDRLDAGADSDVVFGESGNDTLAGAAGRDVLDGGGGNDDLSGGRDSDLMSGGVGADDLVGGAGRDIANGGGARDRCVAEIERSCER